jgi:hypothetical protein
MGWATVFYTLKGVMVMMVDFTCEQLKMIKRALSLEVFNLEEKERLNLLKSPKLVQYEELLDEVDEMIRTAKKRGYC